MSGFISGLGAIGGIVGLGNKILDFLTIAYTQLQIWVKTKQVEENREAIAEAMKIADPRERARRLNEIFSGRKSDPPAPPAAS